MITTTVALQRPKDISLGEIEEELSKIWLSQNQGKVTSIATKAATFSIVVYEPEEFQQLLGGLGFYNGPIDGIHGPETRNAVKEAQKAYKLTITGRVDPQTLAKLREEFAKKPEDSQKITNVNLRGFSMSNVIAAQNPSRVMTLCPTMGEEDTGVTAQVSAYCPIQKQSNSNLVCSEYVTLRGTKSAMQRVDETIKSLMVP
ncbi:MAG: glucose-6-phosphate dehydrogenase assembly protein OpcA, partial [Trichodesmium sp. St11_bin5]|nr:glucose-6-phosphate dehydrogenase assembly protein OpcA [Trichodesmium sp. St11_bin5]